MRSHQWIDRRSRALHEAVADRLAADPALLTLARANLDRWMSTRAAPAWREWQRLLDEEPLAEVLAILRSDDERAARLRQSSPFAGLLSPEERQQILERYDPRRA